MEVDLEDSLFSEDYEVAVGGGQRLCSHESFSAGEGGLR